MTDLLENQAQKQRSFFDDFLDLQKESREVMKNRSEYMSKPPSYENTAGWFTRLYGRSVSGALTTAGDLQSRLKRLVDVEYEVEKDPIRTYVKEVIDNHPEWTPREIENVWELLTTPTEMAERVAESGAYVGGSMASRVIGGWIGKMVGGVIGGIVASAPGAVGGAVGGTIVGQHLAGWLFSYLVTSQRAYETAKEAGSNDEDAKIASEVVGSLVATVELLPFGMLTKIGRSQAQAIKSTILQKALQKGIVSKAVKSHAKKEFVRLMAAEAVEEVLQESAEELVPLFTYKKGEKLQPGFVDRLLQAGIGGAAMAGVFGPGVKLLGTTKGKITGTSELRKLAKTSLEKDLGRTPSRSELNDRMREIRNAQSMLVEEALAPLKRGVMPMSIKDLPKTHGVKVETKEDIDTKLPDSVKDTAKDLFDNGTKVADAVDADEKLSVLVPVLTQDTMDSLRKAGFEVNTDGALIEISFLKQGENINVKMGELDEIIKKGEDIWSPVESLVHVVDEDDDYDFRGMASEVMPQLRAYYEAFVGPFGYNELEYEQYILPRLLGMSYAWGTLNNKPWHEWFTNRIKLIERTAFKPEFLSPNGIVQFQSVFENRLLWSKLENVLDNKISQKNPKIKNLAKWLTAQTSAEELRWTGVLKFLDKEMERAKENGVPFDQATVSLDVVKAWVKNKTPRWVTERRQDYEDSQYRVKLKGRNYHEYLVLMDEQRTKEALGDENYRRLVDESQQHYSEDAPLMLWVAADKIMAADGTSIFRPFEVQSDLFQGIETEQAAAREELADEGNAISLLINSKEDPDSFHYMLNDPNFERDLSEYININGESQIHRIYLINEDTGNSISLSFDSIFNTSAERLLKIREDTLRSQLSKSTPFQSVWRNIGARALILEAAQAGDGFIGIPDWRLIAEMEGFIANANKTQIQGVKYNYDEVLPNTIKKELSSILGRKVELESIDTEYSNRKWRDTNYEGKAKTLLEGDDHLESVIVDMHNGLHYGRTDIQFNSQQEAMDSIDKIKGFRLSPEDRAKILSKGFPYLQADPELIQRRVRFSEVLSDQKQLYHDIKETLEKGRSENIPFGKYQIYFSKMGDEYFTTIYDYSFVTPQSTTERSADFKGLIKLVQQEVSDMLFGTSKDANDYREAMDNADLARAGRVAIESAVKEGITEYPAYALRYEDFGDLNLEEIRKKKPEDRTPQEETYLVSMDLKMRAFIGSYTTGESFYDPQKKAIVIEPSAMEGTLEHELAHHIDNELGLVYTISRHEEMDLLNWYANVSQISNKTYNYYRSNNVEFTDAMICGYIYIPELRQEMTVLAPTFSSTMDSFLNSDMGQYLLNTHKIVLEEAYKTVLKEGHISERLAERHSKLFWLGVEHDYTRKKVRVELGPRTETGTVQKDHILFVDVKLKDGRVITVDKGQAQITNYDKVFRERLTGKERQLPPFTDLEIEALLKVFRRQTYRVFQEEAGSVYRGMTTFDDNGAAIIRAFENSNFSTGFHELFHVVFKGLPLKLQEKIINAAEKIKTTPRGLGFIDWKKKFYPNLPDLIAIQEYLARQYEHYLRSGSTYLDEFRTKVGKTGESSSDFIKKQMTHVYRQIKGSPIYVNINAEMVKFFDLISMAETEGKAEAQRRFNEEFDAKRNEVAPLETPRIAPDEYLKTKEDLSKLGVHVERPGHEGYTKEAGTGDIELESEHRERIEKHKEAKEPAKRDYNIIASKIPDDGSPYVVETIDVEADPNAVDTILETEAELTSRGFEVRLDNSEDGTKSSIIARKASSEEDLETHEALYQQEPVGKEGKKRRVKSRQTLSAISQMFDVSLDLAATQAGRKARYKMDLVHSYIQSKKGEFSIKASKAYEMLNGKDLNWLREVDNDGISNFRKLVEGTVDAPNFATKNLAELIWEIQQNLGEEAIKYGMTRKVEHGITEPFELSESGKLPRLMNPRAHDAVFQGSGEFYEAIVEAIRRLNEELGGKEINRRLSDWRVQPHIKKVGMIEEVRTIPVMPDRVFVDGKWRTVLEQDPLFVIQRMIEGQALRIGMVKEFGQGSLKTAGRGVLNNVAKLAGLKGTLKKAEIISRLEDEGIPIPAKVTVKQLQALAKDAEIDLRRTREEIIQAFLNMDLTKLKPQDIKAFRTMAKKLGGIQAEIIEGLVTKQKPTSEELERMAEVLPAFKETFANRLSMVIDYEYDLLRKQFVEEGGNVQHFDRAMQALQGIPFNAVNRNPITRWTSFISKAVGIAQTSLAFIPNLLQPFSVLPGYIKTSNTIKALKAYHSNKAETRDRLKLLGAFETRPVQKTIEVSTLSRDLGNILQGIGVRVTLLKWATERNNIIAGEGFRLLAEEWKVKGISDEDMYVAKELRLSKEDVETINKGEMSDSLYKRIIQTGVAITQFMSEAPHRKGLAEHNQYLRNLFPYQNYGIGTMKSSLRHLSRIHDSWNNGDWVGALKSSKQLLSLMGRFAVTGMAVKVLREVLTQRPPRAEDEEKEIWEKAVDGLLEVQFLGPAQRTLSLHPSVRDTNAIATMLSPKLKAVLSAVGVVINAFEHVRGQPGSIGKFAEFPASEQAMKVVKSNFGMLSSLVRWHQRFAYPFAEEYFDVKNKLYAFERSFLDEKIAESKTREEVLRYKREKERLRMSVDIPINPDYNKVFLAVQLTGDPEEVMEAKDEYYKKKVDEGFTALEAKQRLRQSLIARSPLGGKKEHVTEFLRSLSPDERKEIVQTQLKYMKLVNIAAPKSISRKISKIMPLDLISNALMRRRFQYGD